MNQKTVSKSFAQWMGYFAIMSKILPLIPLTCPLWECIQLFFFPVCFALCYLFSFLGFKTMSFTHIIAICLLLAFENSMLFISLLSCPVGESSNLFYLSVHTYKAKCQTRSSLWSMPTLKCYAVSEKTWCVPQFCNIEGQGWREFLLHSLQIMPGHCPCWLMLHTLEKYTLRMWDRERQRNGEAERQWGRWRGTEWEVSWTFMDCMCIRGGS